MNFLREPGISNRGLNGRSEDFSDEPICDRVEILFPRASQRTDFDNSDGDRRYSCVHESTGTGKLLFQIFERLPLVEDFEVRRCISRVESLDSILPK
jgi:hypothetical protein